MNRSQLIDGKEVNERYDDLLAPYAQKNSSSVGREYAESARIDPHRTPFQRDRARIQFSRAFRRLMDKMQVVTPRTGDHYRNRYSHSIEVANIARDVARQLRLNEDLVETLAYAHDLGHPPFGHAGEIALKNKMQALGLQESDAFTRLFTDEIDEQEFEEIKDNLTKQGYSFNHNSQGARVVEKLESPYQNLGIKGLNLSWEVRMGIRKKEVSFSIEKKVILTPHMEGQLVDVSDKIAYLAADFEDGLRGEYFSINDEELAGLKVFQEAIELIKHLRKASKEDISRAIISYLIRQLILGTKKNLKDRRIETFEDVQRCDNREKIVDFPPGTKEEVDKFYNFLLRHYWHSKKVLKMTKVGQEIISRLFDILYLFPKMIPEDLCPGEPLELRVCDYIAGMTDKYARIVLEAAEVQVEEYCRKKSEEKMS